MGYLKAKPTAIRVFIEIEPLDEGDSPMGFNLIQSVPKRIVILESSAVTIGNTAEYQALVFDQYNQQMNVEPVMENKTITATQVGVITVRASIGDIVASFDVNIIERVKTKEEQLQELVDQLILDNLNKLIL